MISHASALALSHQSSMASYFTQTVRPLPQVDRFREARQQLVDGVRSRVRATAATLSALATETFSEELANSMTHGVGLVAAIAGGVNLVAAALAGGDLWQTIGCCVFALTLALLYGASTLYHSVQDDQTRHLYRIGDHSCIYLLIAGTYTPFLVTFMRGTLGYSLLGLVWALAALGVANKIRTGCNGAFSTLTYVAMGWIVLLAVKPALTMIPTGALAWLLAGGISYTAGVWFFVQDKKPYYHAIWHLFVLGGSTCHFMAVAGYVAPAVV